MKSYFEGFWGIAFYSVLQFCSVLPVDQCSEIAKGKMEDMSAVIASILKVTHWREISLCSCAYAIQGAKGRGCSHLSIYQGHSSHNNHLYSHPAILTGICCLAMARCLGTLSLQMQTWW